MIFVDTSAVFALASARDLKHREARRLFDALLRSIESQRRWRLAVS